MPSTCAICKTAYLSENGYSEVRKYSVPMGTESRELWETICGMKFSSYARLCEKHFAPSDFIQIIGGKRRRLKRGVVPTLFLPSIYTCEQSEVSSESMKIVEQNFNGDPSLHMNFSVKAELISQTWDENSMHSTTKNLDDSYKSSPHSFENRLLDAVRCHEVLYNSNYPGYSDVDVRNCAWHLIAKDLNVDKNAVKMKWHTLRSAYNKILRKIVAMGGMASYKRKWIYFDKMSFLNPFIPHLLPKDLAEQYSHSKSTTSEDVEQSYKEEPIDMYDFKTPDHYDDEEYADEQEEFDSNRRLSNATDIKQQAKGERVTSLISSTVVDCENNSSDYSRQSKYCDQELLVEMEEDKNEAMHLDLDDSSNTIESPTSTKKRRIDGKRKIIEIETVSKSAGPCNSYFSLLGSKIDETPVPPSERYKLEKRVTDLVYDVLAKYSLETVDD